MSESIAERKISNGGRPRRSADDFLPYPGVLELQHRDRRLDGLVPQVHDGLRQHNAVAQSVITMPKKDVFPAIGQIFHTAFRALNYSGLSNNNRRFIRRRDRDAWEKILEF